MYRVGKSDKKQTVALIIPEPLPGMKELTAAVGEHWATMIYDAIEREQNWHPYIS